MPRSSSDALSQTQRLILTAAAHHAEQQVLCPDTVKPPTFRASLQALRKRGLVAAEAAEGKSRGRGSVRITPEGLAAIGFTPPAPVVEEESAVSEVVGSASGNPRATKQALLITLLSQDEGATLEALSAATRWLPHTTRAALTRLRQRGWSVVTERVAGQSTRYRIAASADAAAAGKAA